MTDGKNLQDKKNIPDDPEQTELFKLLSGFKRLDSVYGSKY